MSRRDREDASDHEQPPKVFYPMRDHSIWPIPDEKPVPVPQWSFTTKAFVFIVNLLVVAGLVAVVWYFASR